MTQDSSLLPGLSEEGVHLIGDFSGLTALCQSGRDLVEAVNHLQCPMELMDLPISPGRMDPRGRLDLTGVACHKPKSRVSVIHWNGDCYSILARDMPPEMFVDRRIIGVWYWETEQELPESHRRGYDLVDEVWVTSQFVADSLAQSSPVPVRKFPHLLKPLTVPAPLQLPEALRNERFAFLFSFDYRSVSKRKNPEAVCEAFVRAFPTPTADGPLCVIKSTAGLSQHELQHLALCFRYSQRPDILFLDGWMSLEERNSLLARADCYISLHRSEGLGLGLMESMSLGKPCIATNYSGNLEFMSQENSWLIPYEKVAVGEGAWPYPPDHTWAEANVDAAATAMREVVANPALASQKGRLGQETILRNHSLDAVSARVKVLLEETINLPVRTKPALQRQKAARPINDKKLAPKELSGRATAYKLLREAKTLEKTARKQKKNLGPRSLTKESADYLQTLQGIIELQRQIQLETLRDLGELKKRLANYHGVKLDTLIRDRDIITGLLSTLVKNHSQAGEASAEVAGS